MYNYLGRTFFLPCIFSLCFLACTTNEHRQDSRDTYVVSSCNALYECTTPYDYRLNYCDGDTLHFETYDEKIGHVDVYIFPIPTNSILGYMKLEKSKSKHLIFQEIKSGNKDVARYHIKSKRIQYFGGQEDYGVYTYAIKEGIYSDYLIKYITKDTISISYMSKKSLLYNIG